MPLSLDLSLSLNSGGLQSDHGAAEHFRLEAELVGGLDDADRAQRIGADHDEIRVGGLNRADDRREVGRVRRVGLVVDDIEAVFLGVVAGAVGGVARELGVLGRNRHGLRLRILRRRDLEEALGERLFRRRTGRQHREIFRVVKLAVGIEREQADEGLALLHDDRNGRRDHVGGVGTDDEVDFVDVEQLGVDAGHVRRVGLVVVIDELNLAAEQAAFGVDLFLPDLGAEQRLLAVGRQRAGQRHAKADFDWAAGALRESARAQGRRNGGRNQRGADAGIDAAPGYAMSHVFLHKSVFSIHHT